MSLSDELAALASRVRQPYDGAFLGPEAFLAPTVPMRAGDFSAYSSMAPDAGTGPAQAFDIADGAVDSGAISDGAVLGAKIADGAVDLAKLRDGAVDSTKIASSVPLIKNVGALPTLPDVLYPVDCLVNLTTTHKLYRNVANAWAEVVNTTDLSGQIVGTQIKDGEISTAKLKANAVTANEIAGHTITANEILADTITAAEIAAGAIGATEIAAGAITTDKLGVGFSRNLIVNPGFETFTGTLGADLATSAAVAATLPGWVAVPTHSNGLVSIYGPVQTTNRHQGQNCLALQQPSAAAIELYLTSIIIPVEPGRSYGIRGFSRGVAANSGAAVSRLTAQWLKSDQTTSAYLYGALPDYDHTNTTTWIEQTARIVAPADAHYVRFYAYNRITSAVSAVVMWDDIEFYEAGYDSAGGTVIDGTGITTNHITIYGPGGDVGLSEAGIGPLWDDYIHLGLLNAQLNAATVGGLPLGTSKTDAAGRTSRLPYWTAWKPGGSGTATVYAYPGFIGGHGVRLRWSAFGATNAVCLTTDAGLVGAKENIAARIWYDNPANPVDIAVIVETDWLDAAGVVQATSSYGPVTIPIGATPGGPMTIDTTPVTNNPGTLPGNARSVRVTVKVYEATAHNAASEVTVLGVQLVRENPTRMSSLMITGNLDVNGGSLGVSYAVDPGVGPSAATGEMFYDTARAILVERDATGRDRGVAPIGWCPAAYPVGGSPALGSAATITLAAVSGGNGGGLLVPIHVPAPMLLQDLTIWCVDTTGAHTAEWRLFYEAAFAVTGNSVAAGTFSFTPTVASIRSSVPTGAPILLAPGIYWLVIRNTSASIAFGIGRSSGQTGWAGATEGFGTKAIAALGSTIDLSTSWAKDTGGAIPIVHLRGRSNGESAAW